MHSNSGNESIFVAIASYRDSELPETLHDLFAQAAEPERVFVGVCNQYLPGEDLPWALRPGDADRVRSIDVPASDARGVGWARAQAQTLWRGEAFSLQVDSHMRFSAGWDRELLASLSRCDSARPILTSYPLGYEPPRKLESRYAGTRLVAREFGPDRILRLSGRVFREQPDQPIRGAFLAGGFQFGSSTMLRDAPSDPGIYFYGEEIALAARLWTHGWDFFHPERSIVYHCYWNPAVKRTHHWSDHKETFDALRRRSNARVLHLLGTEASTDAEAIAGLESFGFGSARSLAAYQEYSGVDFQRQAIGQKAKDGAFAGASKPVSDAGELSTARMPPRLSVTLIVRNEAVHIERVLRCARSIADEIVVVDTGSTDDTRELAGPLADKLVDFSWCDDFSRARNAGIEACEGEFILWLDADDTIDPEACVKLKELLAGTVDWDVLFLPYDYLQDAQGNSTRVMLRERVVRRSLQPRFRYPVHEVLSYPAGARAATRHDIVVRHDNLRRWQSSSQRNRLILRKAVETEEYRESIRIWWMLAREEEPERAVAAFRRLLELLPADHPRDRRSTYHYEFALKLLRLARDDDALAELGQAIVVHPLWREPYFVAAEVHRRHKRHRESLALLRACGSIAPPSDMTHDPTLYDGYRYFDLLSLACQDSGDIAGALDAVERALARLPGDQRLLRHRDYWRGQLKRLCK